jgi:hypothetical protein
MKTEAIDSSVSKNAYTEAAFLIDELDKYLKPSQIEGEINDDTQEKGIKKRFCYGNLNELKTRLQEFQKVMMNFRLENRKYSDASHHQDLFVGIRKLVHIIVESEIDNELKRLLDITEEDRKTFFRKGHMVTQPLETTKFLMNRLNTRINSLNICRKGNRNEPTIK